MNAYDNLLHRSNSPLFARCADYYFFDGDLARLKAKGPPTLFCSLESQYRLQRKDRIITSGVLFLDSVSVSLTATLRDPLTFARPRLSSLAVSLLYCYLLFSVFSVIW